MADPESRIGFPASEFGKTFGVRGEIRSGDLLSDNIARLESLKIKVLQLPGLNERVRNDIFRDLDVLRAALVHGSQSLRINVGPPGEVLRGPPVPKEAALELKIQGIIGQSPRIQKVLRIISKIAATDLTVLMEGETGSGKELFARIIHNNSKRSNFVAVNCGAFPSGLIESELFGHVKGAFTGATHERKGKFEEANGGTIFLDEIGELEMSAQVKLLRVLQEGELQRVGSDQMLKTDVRVIGATNRDLAEMVDQGSFREDLYYRINMCPLFIPPLRERRDEIRILLDFFFQEICGRIHKPVPVLDRELKHFILEHYEFPGNIRELRNLAHFLAYISGDRPVRVDDLPDRYSDQVAAVQQGGRAESAGSGTALDEARDNAEKACLIRALQESGGSVKRVCAELHLSRSRIYQLFKKFGIEPGAYRGGKAVHDKGGASRLI